MALSPRHNRHAVVEAAAMLEAGVLPSYIVKDALHGALDNGAPFLYEHKNLIAAGVCIAATVGACIGAAGSVLILNTYDAIREDAPLTTHAGNVLVGFTILFSSIPTSIGLADDLLTTAQRVQVQIYANLPGVVGGTRR